MEGCRNLAVVGPKLKDLKLTFGRKLCLQIHEQCNSLVSPEPSIVVGNDSFDNGSDDTDENVTQLDDWWETERLTPWNGFST